MFFFAYLSRIFYFHFRDKFFKLITINFAILLIILLIKLITINFVFNNLLFLELI